jgi:transposase InsO family protein
MIDAHVGGFAVTRMARLLGVTPAGYYAWRHRRQHPGGRAQAMARLVAAVRRVHTVSDGTYGSPRVHAQLVAEGWQVSVNTVAKAMRLADVEGISPRRWHPVTTSPGQRLVSVPDLVRRNFDQGVKDKAWFTDITYLRTGQGWAYLCVVRDGHTRRVLGRVIENNMRTDMVEATLRQAVTLRGALPRKVIVHADRGCQYTSGQLAQVAVDVGVTISMGRTGVCWDNAQAEAFWSVFKAEFYHRHVFTTIAAARQASYAWIDGWYNAGRLNSTIGYKTPMEFEATEQQHDHPVP